MYLYICITSQLYLIKLAKLPNKSQTSIQQVSNSITPYYTYITVITISYPNKTM